jgi:hypothetical protein
MAAVPDREGAPAMTERDSASPAPRTDAPLPEISPDKLKKIGLLYGKYLNDDDVAGVAGLETEYARWNIWPHIRFSYPDNQVYYARRDGTQMQIITATGLAAIREAIDEWIRDNSYSWERA